MALLEFLFKAKVSLILHIYCQQCHDTKLQMYAKAWTFLKASGKSQGGLKLLGKEILRSIIDNTQQITDAVQKGL